MMLLLYVLEIEVISLTNLTPFSHLHAVPPNFRLVAWLRISCWAGQLLSILRAAQLLQRNPRLGFVFRIPSKTSGARASRPAMPHEAISGSIVNDVMICKTRQTLSTLG